MREFRLFACLITLYTISSLFYAVLSIAKAILSTIMPDCLPGIIFTLLLGRTADAMLLRTY